MLLSIFLAVTVTRALANDSCEVFFNKQLIFKGLVEQENPVAFIKAKQFTKSDCITIVYYSNNVNKGWNRTFYINGSDERNLKTLQLGKQSGSVSVNALFLNEMKDKKQPVFMYTTSLPADKTLAARIRVRRILICKIEWN